MENFSRQLTQKSLLSGTHVKVKVHKCPIACQCQIFFYVVSTTAVISLDLTNLTEVVSGYSA